ncbi:hypothetical protein [Methylobacterium symbioticum]|uniref:Uncharacterized protein n=1 Tax=Methylobacterium symbioticum TaxID=2584084 RepID=A0A509EFG7_9HYPH|nr:hypothetical protein [Methylobacterium symbioticum]VUD73136.1 hypothetical protein MET9862_03750 [Methylobacterium symbioticum]
MTADVDGHDLRQRIAGLSEGVIVVEPDDGAMTERAQSTSTDQVEGSLKDAIGTSPRNVRIEVERKVSTRQTQRPKAAPRLD